MELYYEQNVVNNNIDERIKKTKTLTVIKTVFLIGGIFALVTCALYWVFALISVPFFIGSFIVGRLNKRNNTEYDYMVDDEYVKISEIYFRERRKLKYVIPLRAMESVGVFDSEGYKKIERRATKRHLALVNYDDEQAVAYILYHTEKGKRPLVFIEPDRGFIIALRRALSSSALTVFDKSISELEKYLAKREQELSVNNAEDEEGTDTDTQDADAENELPEDNNGDITEVENE